MPIFIPTWYACSPLKLFSFVGQLNDSIMTSAEYSPIIAVHGGAGLHLDIVKDPEKKRQREEDMITAAKWVIYLHCLVLIYLYSTG